MLPAERHALLLVGHGSHLSPDASVPVHAHAARIRELGLFDEVGVAFWKEEPAISRALDQFDAETVTVVPLFISDGFFTREVVPRELGLLPPPSPEPDPAAAPAAKQPAAAGDPSFTLHSSLLTLQGDLHGKHVGLTPPVGTHPRLADVIVERAREAGATEGDGLVVLGHGTVRSPQSALAIHEQAGRLRESGAFPEVVALFLDQEPNLRDVFAHTTSRRLVAVPLFIADGWHVGESIPAELGVEAGETSWEGRSLLYAKAVGTHASLVDVILELAGPAPRPLRRPARQTSWLDLSIETGQPFRFGQLRVRPSGWTASVTPVEADPPAGDESGATGGSPPQDLIGGERLRQLVRFDDAGRYRPLPGARTLPGGWRVRDRVERAHEYVDAVYPLSVRQTQMLDDDELRTVLLDEVLARQAGRYRTGAKLDGAGRKAAWQVLCEGHCVKSPLWVVDEDARHLHVDDFDLDDLPVPCPEPCSVMVSLCREAAIWQDDPPAPAPPDDDLPFAAFDRPGNPVREEYLRKRYAGDRIIPLGPRHG